MSNGKAFVITAVPEPLHKAVMLKCVREGTNASAVGRALMREWINGRIAIDAPPDLRGIKGTSIKRDGRALYINNVPEDLHNQVTRVCTSKSGISMSGVGRALFEAWLNEEIAVQPDPDMRGVVQGR